jgi:hypothetical protein
MVLLTDGSNATMASKTEMDPTAASQVLARDHSAVMDLLMLESNVTQQQPQPPAPRHATCFVVMASRPTMSNVTTDLKTATLHPMPAEPLAHQPHAVILWLIPTKNVMMDQEDQPLADLIARRPPVEMVLWIFILVKNVMAVMDAAQHVPDFVVMEMLNLEKTAITDI